MSTEPTRTDRSAGRSRRRLIVLLVAAAVVAVGLTTLLVLRSGGQPVQGTITLFDADSAGETTGGVCSGKGGFSDMRAGANVTVKDGKGEVLATSSLGPGEPTTTLTCEFKFNVEVPKADFYTFEVSHRGGLTFSHEELEGRGWKVGLTLGS